MVAKSEKSEKMVTAVPMHTVIVSRPTGKVLVNQKDQYGEPKKEMQRHVPKIGQEFEFTESEVNDILKMSPSALRRPGSTNVDFIAAVDQAGAAAAATAVGKGAAAQDAFNVGRTAAMGKHVLPDSQNSEADQQHLDEDEDL